MSNATSAVRGLLTYGLVLPLALVVGYLLATPQDLASAGTVGLLLGVLSLPLLLKWHKPLLFLSWNTGATVFFLPGNPSLWMVVSAISLLICIGQRTLDDQMRFISVPSLTLPIVFLAIVVLVTAKFTGGFGMRIFGTSMMGGRRYIQILAAIAGYFAMTGIRIPPEKALLYVGLFFLGGLANAMSTLIPYGPKELYFLAWIFPVGAADAMPVADTLTTNFAPSILRIYGLTLAAIGCFCYLLARFGVRGILDQSKPWRLILVLTIFVLGAMGGFRGFVITLSLTFLLLFAFEGLFRTKYVVIMGMGLILGVALLVPFARHLPLSVQRSLSIFPLDIDPVARYDAEVSSDWRLKMWATVWPEVPLYFWMGKGLGIDSHELELTSELSRRFMISSQEVAMVGGDYHNGPLTVLIPFGIWGLLGWVWFVGAALRCLYFNFRFSEPHLRSANGLLLAFFLIKTVVFFVIFGNFYSDAADFLGLLGLSVSLNHGIRRSLPMPEAETELEVREIETMARSGAV
jgi:hypothetical protein